MDVDADDSIARKRPHAAEETKIAGDSGIVDLPPAKRIKLVEVYDEHEGEFVQNGNATPKRWEKSLVELYEESSDSDDDEPPDRIAATRSGFDPDIMSPIELEYFPEYREYSQDYLKTRNFILMIWKRNSHRFLTWRRIARDMAVRTLRQPLHIACSTLKET